MPGVYFNTQVPAALAVLTFLGTVAVLAVAGVVGLVLLFRRRFRLAGVVTLLAALGAGFNLTVLLLLSFSSHEHTARLGEEKYFCEIDCHLAYSVVEVSRVKTLGPPGAERHARGTFVVVRLKTRFDEQTISSHRPKDMPLSLNPRAAGLVDAASRRFLPSVEGLRALERSGGGQPLLSQSLKPGESYTTALVFDVPEDVGDARLLLTEAAWETSLLIGHENSFFHRKTYFSLKNPTGTPPT